MADVVGFLVNNGVGSVNAVLLVALGFLIRGSVRDMSKKVDKLWEWHLIQRGIQRAEHHLHDEEDES